MLGLRDVDSVRQFASAFIGVPAADIPSDKEVLIDSLVSECTRLALESAVPDADGWRLTHTTALRTWVERKMRSVLDALDHEEDDVFTRVVSGSVGPSLEFVGDVLRLERGMMTGAPTRAIRVDESRYILISGLPSVHFIRRGMRIIPNGIGRWIQARSVGQLADAHVPIQALGSYAGPPHKAGPPEDFLEGLVSARSASSGAPLGFVETYHMSSPGSKAWDFEYGPLPWFVNDHRGASYSVLRETGEWGRERFWLKRSKSKDVTLTQLERSDATRAMLALDSIYGQPRKARFETHSESAVLHVSARLPRPDFRIVYAMGGRWTGFSGGEIHWRIPMQAVEALRERLSALWLSISTTPKTAFSES